MMLERGVVVSHETVRQWCAKFGQTYANGLRRRRPRPGDKWHLDGVQPRYGQKPPSAVLNGDFLCSGWHGLSVFGSDRSPHHESRHPV
jgi:hypothetical protein